MEIGNMLFGHSRGIYEFPDRNLSGSRSWTNLLEAVHADDYGILLHDGYENDSIVEDECGGYAFHIPDGTIFFEIFPYYWGEAEELKKRHNFIYKPGTKEELAIDWCKYPFRDAYLSKPVSKQMLKRIWEECTKTVKRSK